jgi:hypothetical protein
VSCRFGTVGRKTFSQDYRRSLHRCIGNLSRLFDEELQIGWYWELLTRHLVSPGLRERKLLLPPYIREEHRHYRRSR